MLDIFVWQCLPFEWAACPVCAQCGDILRYVVDNHLVFCLVFIVPVSCFGCRACACQRARHAFFAVDSHKQLGAGPHPISGRRMIEKEAEHGREIGKIFLGHFDWVENLKFAAYFPYNHCLATALPGHCRSLTHDFAILLLTCRLCVYVHTSNSLSEPCDDIYPLGRETVVSDCDIGCEVRGGLAGKAVEDEWQITVELFHRGQNLRCRLS